MVLQLDDGASAIQGFVTDQVGEAVALLKNGGILELGPVPSSGFYRNGLRINTVVRGWHAYTALADANAPMMNGYRIGADRNKRGSTLNGSVGEGRHLRPSPDRKERQAVAAYLSDKWGTP